MEFVPTKPRVRARAIGLIAVAGLLASACAPAASTPPSEAPAAPTDAAASPSGAASADPMADLIAAAQAEGALTAIALPDDWCNYGEVISRFEAKYGIDVNASTPWPAPARRSRPSRQTWTTPAPRTRTWSTSASRSASEQGPLQPYKVATWDTIPESAKGPDGSGTATTTASCHS